MAREALCRQTLEVRTGCGTPACPDLCGGRSAMSVPTAITNIVQFISGALPLPTIRAVIGVGRRDSLKTVLHAAVQRNVEEGQSRRRLTVGF